MRSAFLTLALSALAVAKPMPAPEYPGGCSPNYAGKFSISQVNVSSSGSKRSLLPRDTQLNLTLHNGKLTDSEGRTGYIAANNQFQFDGPPQAGAKTTSGFSVCANGSLALDSAVWTACRSGTFYNLYDYNSSPQCFPVYLEVVGGSGASPDSYGPAETSSTAAATPTGYGGKGSATAAAGSAATGASGECSQIGDGQAQCTQPASTPSCGEGDDGQPQCTSAAAAAATTPPPARLATPKPAPSAVCGIMSDGQPQCSSSAPTYTGAPIAPAPNAGNAFGVQHQMFGLAIGVLGLVIY